jgi:hypothetical protein
MPIRLTSTPLNKTADAVSVKVRHDDAIGVEQDVCENPMSVLRDR